MQARQVRAERLQVQGGRDVKDVGRRRGALGDTVVVHQPHVERAALLRVKQDALTLGHPGGGPVDRLARVQGCLDDGARRGHPVPRLGVQFDSFAPARYPHDICNGKVTSAEHDRHVLMAYL